MEAKSIPKRCDDEVIAKLHALEQLQQDRIQMENELQQKIKDLVAEYDARLAQLDAKRRAIVTGALVPTEEEEECKSDFADPTSPCPNEPKLKGIPNFWLRVLLNVPVFDDIIRRKDARVLKYLLDVRCIIFKGDLRGFRLEFEFSENQYITNSVLTKEFYHSSKEDSSNRFAFIEDGHPDRMVGCQIDWKAKKKVKPISRWQQWREDSCPSFFDFFSVSTKESICDLSFDSDIEEQRVGDFSVGDLMRDQVLPRSLDYFIGDKDRQDEFDERIEDAEEEEVEQEEEDDGEEDSDEDEDSGEEDDEEEDPGESDDDDDDEMEEDEDIDDGKDEDEHNEDEEEETEDEDHSEPPTKKFKPDASRGEGAKLAN